MKFAGKWILCCLFGGSLAGWAVETELESPPDGPRLPANPYQLIADRKVFVTPLEHGFRVAGTVEFGGLLRPPDTRRFALLGRLVREAFPGRGPTWLGLVSRLRVVSWLPRSRDAAAGLPADS